MFSTSSDATRASSTVPMFLNLAAISNVSLTVRSPWVRRRGGGGEREVEMARGELILDGGHSRAETGIWGA